MGDRKIYLVNQIVKYAHKLDEKGFVANHDGNITAKFEDGLLATPTAISKSNMVPELIIAVDYEGKKKEGTGKPFSEIQLHLAAYRARPDITAVIHAHPPFSTARGLVGLPLYPLLPEAVVSIGGCIPVTHFAMPGAPENDTLVAEILTQTDVFMMPGNGVLAVGDSVEQAYLRLELVEHLIKIEYYAKSFGNPIPLSSQDLDILLKKRASIGLGYPGQKPILPDNWSPSSSSHQDQSPISELEKIKNLIAEEIKKALKEM